MKKGQFRVKITKAGAIYIFLTIFIGVAAINTGNNMLYLITSFMLAVMGLSGLSSFINLLGLEFVLSPKEEIYAQKRTLFALQIHNKKYFPSLLLGIDTGEKTTWVIYLPPQGGIKTTFWLSFSKRGWQKAPSLRIYSYFPLGFFARGFTLTSKEKFLVYPRPIYSHLSPTNSESPANMISTSTHTAEDFKGIREYTQGDSLRHVHWLITARVGQLVVKEFTGGGKREIWLKLSGAMQDIETHLGRLTYACNYYFKLGYAVGLKTPRLSLPPKADERQRKKILQVLATYEGH